MSNPIYDADRAIAAALQSPALQQNALLHAIGKAFNWWGGPGVIWLAALLWLGGRALKNSRVSLVGLRGAGFTYDGLYYVKSVSHAISKGQYKQRFSLTREGTGAITPVVVQ